MKIIKFDKWTRKTTNKHAHGFTQTINERYINIIIFGFIWKAMEWDEYINEYHEQ